MRKSTTRIVGLVVSLALGAATYAQQAQEYQVTVFVQQSGVDDRGQITVGARVAATDGFDSSLDLADPHAPAWPHSYLDLVTVHQKTDPGWASQALQAMAYRRDFIAIHGLSARTFAMTLRADSGTPTTLSWFPLDPASGIAPFNVTLHEGGSAVDMWTATSYTWSPTATETPISIELTPGRATAPVAYNQTIVINEDSGGVVVTLKSQDWDECEMASFEIFNAPTFGSVGPVQPRPCTPGVPNVDTAFITYTPNPNVAGGDAFSFKVTDGSGATSFAVVSIDIVAINDAPFAPDSSFTLDEDAPTNVLLEAVDPDQQGQLYTIVMAPAHGTVSAPPSFPVLSTTVVYTPDRNYIGPDVFTWKCNDGAVDSNAAAVTLTVNPIDGPVAILSLQPAKAGIGDPVLADASASFHRFPPKGIAKYAFAFGDGFSYEETAASAPDGAFDGKTTHAYSALGTYTVALTVTDDASPPVSDTMTANATIVGVDVAIQDVDAGGIQYDGQALTVSGLARATVRNLSALDVLRPFDVRFFEDRNGNGVYDAGTDASLGLATVAAPLLFSESRVVAAPVSGSVLFSGNRVFAFVDSGNALTEVHEENNVAGSGSLCKVFGATQTFAPQQRFLAQAADLNTTLSGSDVASAVVDLNGDGVKDIVWLGIDPQTGFTPWGNLVAASGVDGTELWHREQDDVPARGFPATAVAVAQLDSDPEPELVITRAFGAGVTVFEHDGSLKWTFSENGFATAVTEVAIADLDADGTPEIVIDRNVVNADGSIRWHGALPANGNGTLESTVVDLDLDGKPEVLAGGMAYRADGTLLFESPALLPHDGYESLSSAIPGNFDDDPFPELVLSVMNRGEVWLLDHEGNPIWGPVTMPDLFGQRRVGSATVGDIDGDGKPEIAVASWEQLRIIEHDGTTKWTHAIDDGSSGSCHATFFDLDGDGSVEVLFADQTSFWIFRGNDGAVLFQGTRSSHTGEDQVVVTDLDGDGHAEVLVGHNSQVLSDNGVQVLEAGPGHEWVAARPTWNQFTYHIGNVNDDFTVPTLEENSWHTHNTYTSQQSFAYRAPNVVPSYVRAVDNATDRTITARVGNGGQLDAPAGLTISFYQGDPNSGGTLLGTATTSGALAPGAYEDVSITVPLGSGTAVWVWADHGGTDLATECNESDNLYDSTRQNGNGAPSASADSYSGQEDTDLVAAAPGVLGNDTDPDSDLLAAVLDASPAHGTVTLASNGSFRYVPQHDFNGNDSFTYHATDGAASSSVVTVSLTIAPVNDPPVAASQSVTTPEDTNVAITLSASDVDSGSLTYAIVAGPSHGTLTGTAPNVTYHPAQDFHGADTFTFRANDGQADSNIAVVTIVVTPVNDVPVASPQNVTTAMDTPVSITLHGTDVDGDPLTFFIVAQPAHGSLTGGSGGYSYTPALGYTGSDSFTFKCNDGQADSNVALVGITVTATNTNRPPSAFDQGLTTAEDAALSIVLTGGDPDGDPLTFTLLSSPAHGMLSGTPPSLTYTPAADYFGGDSFTFKVNDGHVDSNVATIGITVTPVNDRPVANPQSVATTEDTPVAIILSGSDVEGDPITFAIDQPPAHGTLFGTPPNVTYAPASNFNGSDSFTFKTSDGQLDSLSATVSIDIAPVNDQPTTSDVTYTTPEDTSRAIVLTAVDVDMDPLTFTIESPPSHGTLSGTPPNVTYNPALNYSGPDSFTFKANDGQADSNVSTVTIDVTPVNDAPVAQNQSVTTREGYSVAITLTATDVDSGTLTFAIVTSPSHGTLSGTPPNVTYTPAAGFNGSDSFTFKANDGQQDSNVATVTVTITPNARPVANSQTVTTPEDTSKAITLTGSDGDGDPLTFSIVGGPAHGTLTGAAPNVTYVPATNFNGSDSFTFKVNDGQSDSNVATVSITATPVNDPPVADDKDKTTTEDTSVAIILTASDVDGDALTYSVVAGPSHGSLSGTAPNLTYSPAANGNGSDSFTYRVNDGHVNSNVATVSITIDPVNDQPVANDQSVTTDEDIAKAITLTASDVENDPLTYTVVTGPAHGTLSGTAPNVTYHPATNYNGPDSFTFKCNDGHDDSNTATVSITVTPVNDAPVANNLTVTTQKNTPVAITLVATDVDGDPLTYGIVTVPGHGVVAGAPPNVTYTPALNYTGPDSFSYKAYDGHLDSNVATVSITVMAPQNHPPSCSSAVASPVSLWPPNHKWKSIQILGVTDQDGDAVTLTVTSVYQDEPVNGLGDGDTSPDAILSPLQVRSERSGQGDGRVYHIGFTASDGHGGTCQGTVTVCVPHDQGQGNQCVDGGSLYDSTQQ